MKTRLVFAVMFACLIFCGGCGKKKPAKEPSKPSPSVAKKPTPAELEYEIRQKSKKGTKADILGVWMMTYQATYPGLNTNSIFYADFQVFEFSDDGYVKNIASTRSLEQGSLRGLLQSAPRRPTYKFAGDGILVIERSPKDMNCISVTIMIGDMTAPLRDNCPVLKKGDMIFTYVDANKRLYMQRFLKKVTLDDGVKSAGGK